MLRVSPKDQCNLSPTGSGLYLTHLIPQINRADSDSKPQVRSNKVVTKPTTEGQYALFKPFRTQSQSSSDNEGLRSLLHPSTSSSPVCSRSGEDYKDPVCPQKQHKTPSPEDLSLFVGGLSNSVTNQALWEYFGKYGTIASVEVQMWKNNPEKCRGFATVIAKDFSTFEAILRQDHYIEGRFIECKRMIRDKEVLEQYTQEQIEKKVFVSGLSKKVDDWQLKEFFSQFGPVKMAYVVKHHKDKKSKGFGFVTFENKKDKLKVLNLQEIMIGDKKVVCTEYSTRMELKKLRKDLSDGSEIDVKMTQATESTKNSSVPRKALQETKLDSKTKHPFEVEIEPKLRPQFTKKRLLTRGFNKHCSKAEYSLRYWSGPTVHKSASTPKREEDYNPNPEVVVLSRLAGHSILIPAKTA